MSAGPFSLSGLSALVTGRRHRHRALDRPRARRGRRERRLPRQQQAAGRNRGQRRGARAKERGAARRSLGPLDGGRTLVDATVSELGGIDILINNAGMIRRAPATEFALDDWELVLQVNLSSVFQLCQLAGRRMIANGHGKIVNVASLLTFQGGITVPAYAASKGGVGQLTKALANEWAARGVNVNAIAPGYIRTENTAALQKDETRSRQILERIPAGRWGEATDLGGAAVFLCSRASDYVHGHTLVVDGGWMGR